MLIGRQSYSGVTLGPVSSCTANIGMYTWRNCSGLTAALTTASISSSLGQMSFRRISLPSTTPSTSFSMSKRMVPAIA
ncbi:hypothetical protein D3C76_1122410 [compost metagenome]